MVFLPHAAALRSPYNWSLPYTTRVSAQDVIDRLFLSIVSPGGPAGRWSLGPGTAWRCAPKRAWPWR